MRISKGWEVSKWIDGWWGSPRDDALALLLTLGSPNTWYGDFHPAIYVPCLAHTLEQKLLDFQSRYEQIAKPFKWKFTKEDLNRILSKFYDYNNCQNQRMATQNTSPNLRIRALRSKMGGDNLFK